MKQFARRKVITYRWWRDGDLEIVPEHVGALKESAEARIAEMAAQGYGSGELCDNITMADDDPEDGVEYSGRWKVEERTGTPDGDEAEKAFLQYISDRGFDPAVDVCPVESGEFLFTDGDALDLVPEFINEHPEYGGCLDRLEYVAGDVGQISTFARQ